MWVLVTMAGAAGKQRRLNPARRSGHISSGWSTRHTAARQHGALYTRVTPQTSMCVVCRTREAAVEPERVECRELTNSFFLIAS